LTEFCPFSNHYRVDPAIDRIWIGGDDEFVVRFEFKAVELLLRVVVGLAANYLADQCERGIFIGDGHLAQFIGFRREQNRVEILVANGQVALE
jgi:hypothetical protein